MSDHPDLAQALYAQAAEHEAEIADQRRIDAAYAQTTTQAAAVEGAAPATTPTGRRHDTDRGDPRGRPCAA